MDLGTLETLRVTVTNGIAEVVVSRPKALNAINKQVLLDLGQVVDKLALFPDLRAVILTGDGEKAFVAGADIAEMANISPAEAQAFSKLGHDVFDRLASLPVPVLGAINGFALGGGCELALACDILYASEKAKFGQPEVKLGLVPGFGGSVRLPRKIGLAAASEWLYTGEIYSAQQAKDVGLVREVVAPEALLPRVRDIAGLIAKRAPLAIRALKTILAQGVAAHPETASRLEYVTFGAMFATADMREGTQAFLAKRDAQFTSK